MDRLYIGLDVRCVDSLPFAEQIKKSADSTSRRFFLFVRQILGHVFEREVVLAKVGHETDAIDALHGACGSLHLDGASQFRHVDRELLDVRLPLALRLLLRPRHAIVVHGSLAAQFTLGHDRLSFSPSRLSISHMHLTFREHARILSNKLDNYTKRSTNCPNLRTSVLQKVLLLQMDTDGTH